MSESISQMRTWAGGGMDSWREPGLESRGPGLNPDGIHGSFVSVLIIMQLRLPCP